MPDVTSHPNEVRPEQIGSTPTRLLVLVDVQRGTGPERPGRHPTRVGSPSGGRVNGAISTHRSIGGVWGVSEGIPPRSGRAPRSRQRGALPGAGEKEGTRD